MMLFSLKGRIKPMKGAFAWYVYLNFGKKESLTLLCDPANLG